MSVQQDADNFFTETGDLLRRYVRTRIEILRLQGIRAFAKAAGTLVWAMLILFLLFLMLIFIGLVIGFGFSALFHSYTAGFAAATGILLLMVILLILLRKPLFIHPIIRAMVQHLQEEPEDDEETNPH